MKQRQHIEKVFPKHLFWDMDYSKLSFSRDKAIIIPRALYATSKRNFAIDIKKLEQFYSKQEIVECLKNTKEHISNEVCLLVAKKYNVKPFYRYKI